MKNSKAGRRGPCIVVRRSGIHRRGVFARRLLREGETVCECKGERVSEPEIGRRYPEDMDGLNHTFVFGVEHDLNIDGGVNGNIARWINHACDPNCDARRKTSAYTSRPSATSGLVRSFPTTMPSMRASRSPKR